MLIMGLCADWLGRGLSAQFFCVQHFAALWTVAHQALLPMGFSRPDTELEEKQPGTQSWAMLCPYQT